MNKLVKHLSLTAPQAAFLDATTPYKAFVGGRGAGKSYIGAYDLIKRSKPGRLYLVGNPTYNQVRDSTLRSFREVGAWLGVIRKLNLGTDDIHAWLGNGAEIIFRSADKPDRWRGPNLSGAWLDEASQMDRDAFDIVIACLRERGEQGFLSATFTPHGLEHWTYPIFGKLDAAGNPPPGVTLIRSRTRDNPFLPEGFEEMIRQQYGPVQAAQELEGDFVEPAGVIFQASWLRSYTIDGEYRWLAVPFPGGQVRRLCVQTSNLRTFITVDLAASQKTSADYTVISVWGDDGRGNLLLLEVERKHMETPDVLPTAWAMLRRWKAQYVGIESYGFQLSVVQHARREGMPVRELRHRVAQSNKVSHSVAAQVRMQAGQVFFPEPGQCPWVAPLIDELLHFNADAKRDDFVDTLSYAAEEMVDLYDKGKSSPPRVLHPGPIQGATPYTH